MAEKVYVGLGCNLPPKSEHMAEGMRRLENAFPSVRFSRIHHSKPYRIETEFAFLNAAAELDPGSLGPEGVLAKLGEIELRFGRIRNSDPSMKTDREIDLDILLFGDRVIDLPGLKIPHHDLNNRDFFLVPMLELNPDLVRPTDGKPYRDALKRIPAALRSLDS